MTPMNWHALFVAALATVMPAVLMQMFPMWQRRFFFTVRVAEGFQQTVEGRRILMWFRVAISSVALACGWSMFAGITSGTRWLTVPAPLINSVAMIGLVLWARRKTLPFAEPPGGAVRRAMLGGDEDEPWWIWAAPLVGLGILACAGALISVSWEAIPERFPIHWGIAGNPDRWSRKSLLGVYGSFLIGLAVQLMMAFFLYALSQTSGKVSTRRRLNQGLAALVVVTVALIHSMVVLLPLQGAEVALPGPAWLRAVPVLVLLAPVVVLAIRLQRLETDESEPTLDEKWLAGLLYSDSADSRMMVPNRLGPGFTFNIGHPVVRLVVPVLLVLILGSVFAIPAFSRH